MNTGSATWISASDLIIFNAAPGSGNVDTVTNFNRNNPPSPRVQAPWVRIILDRKFFPNITAHYAGSATGVSGGISAVSATNIENFATGVATQASTRLIFQTGTSVASGAGRVFRVFYDPDGVGGAVAVQFATLLRDTTNPLLVGLVGFTNSANIDNVNVGIIECLLHQHNPMQL